MEYTWIKQDIAILRVFIGTSFELVCIIRVIILSNGLKDNSSYRTNVNILYLKLVFLF